MSVHGPEIFSIFNVLHLQLSSNLITLSITIFFLTELIHQTVTFLFKQLVFSFISACQSFLFIIFYSDSCHQKSCVLQVLLPAI